MKMRSLFACLSLCCISATTLHAASPIADAKEKLVHISLRICEGKAGSKPGDESVKVITAPQIVTTEGQSAQINIGAATLLPKYADQMIEFGTRLDVTPSIATDGKIILKIAVETTDLVKSRSSSQVTVKGSSMRSIIVADSGEKSIVEMATADGKETWIEVTPSLQKQSEQAEAVAPEIPEPTFKAKSSAKAAVQPAMQLAEVPTQYGYARPYKTAPSNHLQGYVRATRKVEGELTAPQPTDEAEPARLAAYPAAPIIEAEDYRIREASHTATAEPEGFFFSVGKLIRATFFDESEDESCESCEGGTIEFYPIAPMIPSARRSPPGTYFLPAPAEEDSY